MFAFKKYCKGYYKRYCGFRWGFRFFQFRVFRVWGLGGGLGLRGLKSCLGLRVLLQILTRLCLFACLFSGLFFLRTALSRRRHT